MRTRRALVALLVTLLGVAGCSLFADDPADTYDALASALTTTDVDAAAGHTDDAASARAAITSMYAGMGFGDRAAAQKAGKKVSVRAEGVDSKSGRGSLEFRWTFGPGKEFAYRTEATATDDDGWRVHWDPTLLHPALTRALSFQYSDDKDLETPVTDRRGLPLLTWQTVGVVTVARDQAAARSTALAGILNRIDPSITARSIRSSAESAGSDSVAVVTLRATDLATVRGRLRAVPGVSVSEQGKLLTVDRSLRSPALAQIPDRWNDRITASAGWSVDLVDGAGTTVDRLATRAPGDVDAVPLTMDLRLQRLAQQAVAGETKPTALVAISASTGGILAVAQNTAADRQGPIALSGLYPPGSTFKTVTTAAALQSGDVTAATPLPCPGRATIENRTIPNEDEFDLGTVPLRTAFAQSCNTTMGALSDKLGPTALRDTAARLGIGVDFVAPGITTVTGSVPAADTPAQRVESGIGQGRVTTSPFGLAVAEASLAHGSMILPSLLSGQTTTADQRPAALDPAVVSQIRSLMRDTVTTGTARSLRDIPGLGGKTGTAEFGDNSSAHGWFAGILGDVAFATLVVGGDSSSPAVSVSGQFLRGSLGD
ncbi:penicillin-binding transpeptidase domain-containing protein [Williamsia maris]|uniref:Cell division protein FtsI/penicillin-binding protein 2 n=1 Tax=Williamsia maris TaxID=72806 RepID=A0ABT1HDZ5_9NOCA|nr:penicillin-binding transpeptidase domain-containing protein [Williamsia maris]MCP2176147.1 Cell division protein FtsI/penicillin-binding protein 2 [Williamsia maris]